MVDPRTFEAPKTITDEDIVGLKYFRHVRKLLRRLSGHKDHPNRTLHYDEYVALLLLYFFNPVLTSLRTLVQASDLRKIRRNLGIRHASLGSLSEASHVFDPALLCHSGQRPFKYQREMPFFGVSCAGGRAENQDTI